MLVAWMIGSQKHPLKLLAVGGWPRTAVFLASGLLLLWFLAWSLAQGLIVRSEPSRADAIIVLSGSTYYRERVRWAAQLFRQGRAPLLVITNDNEVGGWSSSEQRNPFFFEREVSDLRAAGVPSDNIIVLPEPVTNTYEEAQVIRQFAQSRGVRALLIVTSAYHSRRALWTMRRVFEGTETEIGIEPVPPGEDSPLPATWWLHRRGWKAVAAEALKLIYYRIYYGALMPVL